MTNSSAPQGMTLVTGATGSIGGCLVDELVATEQPFRVMCRRPEQVRDFESHDIEAVLGDFSKPASVHEAMTGVDQLFLLPPDGPEMVDQVRRTLDSAGSVGVRQVVKLSTADSNPDSPVPWARDHGRIDDYLRDSGLDWTALHPAAFMSNLVEMAPVIRRGILPGSSGHGATTWIDTADIAAAACAVLTDPERQGGPGDDGRDYLLTGTQPLSFPQIAAVLTAELGHRVRYLHVPGPLMYLGLRASGSPHSEARGLVAQFAVIVRRGLDHVREHSEDLTDLIGREPVDMAHFVADHAADFS